MIHVGFIGCGRIADLHVLGYANRANARLSAVCDADPERAEARRQEWSAERAYTDYRQLLADPGVDAVEVLTPYDTHEQIVVDALAAGKHVAVQKPMTTDLRSADRMIAAAKRAEGVYKVTELYLNYPPLVRAKQLLDSGAIGEPVGMRIKYVSSTKGGWHVPASTYQQQMRLAARGLGFETFDHGHHEWAVAWWFLGEPERVCAWVDSNDGILDVPAIIMWKCRDSLRYGTCDFMHAPDLTIPSEYYANDEWFEVTGTEGILLVNRGTGHIHEGPPVSVFTSRGWQHYDDMPCDWADGFRGATENFLSAIEGREPPLLSGSEGRTVLRFGLAVQRSAALRREVYVEELDSPLETVRGWFRRRRERLGAVVGRPRHRQRDRKGYSRYAPRADELTRQLPSMFDPAVAKDWDCVVGLELTPDGGVNRARYTIVVREGKVEVRPGMYPEEPGLALRLPAGLWAAILLGRKRIETAVLQGKIDFDGRAEEGLRLKKAFRL